MIIIDRLISLFLKHSLPKHEDWHITDHIIQIRDITCDIKIESKDLIDQKDAKLTYVCIRNYADTLVYIPQDKYEEFKQINSIYNETLKLINVSNITKHKIFTNAISIIANRITPPIVKIKNTMRCDINGIHIVVVRIMNLSQEEELYKSLISYEILKEKYKIE